MRVPLVQERAAEEADEQVREEEIHEARGEDEADDHEIEPLNPEEADVQERGVDIPEASGADEAEDYDEPEANKPYCIVM